MDEKSNEITAIPKLLKILVKNNRLAAGWDDSYLEQVLFGRGLWCNRLAHV